jgi:glycosyltransferase involved in cell wall biosynthesis
MTSSALVSVVIPCYRQGHLLSQAIDSVLAQTHRPIEIVVVNDGSDDDTDSVARGYGDQIVYVSKPNGGLSSARNAGIARATGRHLLFLDADDLLRPNAIATLASAVAGNARTVALMGHWRFPADKPDQTLSSAVPQHSELLPALFRGNNPVHAYLCPRQLVLDAGGFDERLRSHEDWDLWFRVAIVAASVVSVAVIGAGYRQVTGSMSRDQRRMASSFAQLTICQVPRFLERPDLLAKHGCELARMVYAARRRLRIHCGAGAEYDAELTAAVHELRRRGVHPSGPLPVVIQDRLPVWLGDRFERLGIRLASWFLPRLVEAS